ncbi:hypothetical protein [Galbibacter sp. BG1]
MKLVSLLCIVAGAILVFMFNNQSEYDKYLKILGFILLMFGLYQSTKLWVKDNPKEDKKQDKKEDEKSLEDHLKDN